MSACPTGTSLMMSEGDQTYRSTARVATERWYCVLVEPVSDCTTDFSPPRPKRPGDPGVDMCPVDVVVAVPVVTVVSADHDVPQ
jgi:hypothetical protein